MRDGTFRFVLRRFVRLPEWGIVRQSLYTLASNQLLWWLLGKLNLLIVLLPPIYHCVMSTTNWIFPHFSPTCFAQRRVREISFYCRYCSQGSCSYFYFPLDITKIPKMTIVFISQYCRGLSSFKDRCNDIHTFRIIWSRAMYSLL